MEKIGRRVHQSVYAVNGQLVKQDIDISINLCYSLYNIIEKMDEADNASVISKNLETLDIQACF